MIFIKPKRKREEFTSSFSYIIWNTNMQNPHHWKKKINKIKWILHQGLACLSEGAQMEPQTWLVITIYTQSEDKLKTWSVGWCGVSSWTPHPRPPSAPAWGAAPQDSRGGCSSSSHMAYLMKGNSLKIKNGEEQQKWRRREKCNVQHIYTAAWTASRAEDQS